MAARSDGVTFGQDVRVMPGQHIVIKVGGIADEQWVTASVMTGQEWEFYQSECAAHRPGSLPPGRTVRLTGRNPRFDVLAGEEDLYHVLVGLDGRALTVGVSVTD